MKNLYISRLLLAIIGLLFLSPLHSQFTPTKLANKIETSFRNGDYTHSTNLCTKYAKKFERNPSSDKLIYAEILLCKLKNQIVSSGNLYDLTPIEATYLEQMQKLDLEKSSYYALGLSKIAQIYALYGFQNIAFQRIDQALSLSEGFEDSKLKNEILLNQAYVLNAIGEYRRAFALAKSLDAYAKSKIVENSDNYILTDGVKNKGSYSTKQLIASKRSYADYLNFVAQVKQNEGDYIYSDSLCSKAYDWILANIDPKARDVSAFDNRMILIKNYEKLDQNNYAYQFTFNKIVGTKAGLKPSIDKTFGGYTYLPESEAYMEYEEYLARHYWSMKGINSGDKNQADGFYSKHHSFYERAGVNRNNSNIIKAELMLLDKYILSNNFPEAKLLADTLLTKAHANKSLFLTNIHPLKRQILLRSIFIAAEMGLSKEAQKNIATLQEVDKESLVQNSPMDKFDRLYIAGIQHQIWGNFKEPLAVFNNLFVNDFEYSLHPLNADHRNLTNVYTELLTNAGQFEKSNNLINEEIKTLSPYKFQNSNLYAYELIKKADILLKSGNYKEASVLLTESKNEGEIYKIITHPEFNTTSTSDQYFRVLTRRHIIYGDLAAAKKSMNSIEILKEDDFIEFAPVFVAAGKTEYISYKLDELETQYNETYGSTSPKSLTLLNNIANIEAQKGEFGKAAKKSLQSLSIAENNFGKTSYQYANASFVNGTVASNFGDYKTAISEFGKSKTIYKNIFGEKNVSYARSLSEQSLAKLFNNDKSDEIAYDFMNASNIVKNTIGYSTFENATILKNQAFYYLETGKPDFAERDIAQSIQILTDLGEKEYKQLLAENYRITARIQQFNKEFKASENSYKKALSYYYDLFDNKQHIDITLTKSNLAQLYYQQGERNDSKSELNKTTEIYLAYIEKYFSYLTEREKKEFWKKINQDFEFYKTIAFEENKKKEVETVYNNALTTKGILLNSSKQLRDAIASSTDNNLKETFELWSHNNEILTRANSMSNEQLREENVDLEQLQKEIDKLEKTLSEKSSEFASQNKKLSTWEDVRNALQPNEYAIEIIRYNKFNNGFTDTVQYKALILGKDYNTPKVIDLGNGNKLDSKNLTYYRNTTRFKKQDFISYKAFYEPIYKVVGQNAKVFISLEGVYNLINLETMLMPDTSYVMDKNQIIIVSSTKDIIDRNEILINTHASRKSLIVANPMYYAANLESPTHGNIQKNAEWKQLPGAEKEGQIVDSMFAKSNWETSLVKWDKAEESIIKNLGKSQYKDISYLHISTHGFFKEASETTSLANDLDSRRGLDDPYLRAGLLFKNGGDIMKHNSILNYNISDGVLTAKEISTLDLKGIDIVVLSACETGLGDIASGEGVYGLQRAFLSAGVKMIVISLFKVDDLVTTKFMTAMDRKFLETNNPRLSMEYAKKEIQKEYPEPIYWGSFILVD